MTPGGKGEQCQYLPLSRGLSPSKEEIILSTGPLTAGAGQLPTALCRASETQGPSKGTMDAFSSIISPVLNVYVDSSESYLPEKPACLIGSLALNKTSAHLDVLVGFARE